MNTFLIDWLINWLMCRSNDLAGYTCVARNGEGRIHHTIRVIVAGTKKNFKKGKHTKTVWRRYTIVNKCWDHCELLHQIIIIRFTNWCFFRLKKWHLVSLEYLCSTFKMLTLVFFTTFCAKYLQPYNSYTEENNRLLILGCIWHFFY